MIRPNVIGWGLLVGLCSFWFSLAQAMDNPRLGRLALVCGLLAVYAVRVSARR